MHAWRDPVLRQNEMRRMRQINAEWDFMGRTFLVWSLANLSLRDAAWKTETLPVMDAIIRETMALENASGVYVFLLPYARENPFRERPVRSVFVDGEIALMLAARQAVAPAEEFRQPLIDRMALIESRLRRSPMFSAESYPNECWTFDHAVAIAALTVGDAVTGMDHHQTGQEWLGMAKAKLIDPKTGLLVSRYTMDGEVIEGPEGSSLWMVSHCLALVNEPFARGQYERARREIGRSILGFGYAHEWPNSWQGQPDVDSGPIIPVLDISAGSSGLAFIGAIQFKDQRWMQELHSTLEMAAFPVRRHQGVRYAASNQVGDAVLLYATTMGPLWAKAKKGSLL